MSRVNVVGPGSAGVVRPRTCPCAACPPAAPSHSAPQWLQPRTLPNPACLAPGKLLTAQSVNACQVDPGPWRRHHSSIGIAGLTGTTSFGVGVL